MKYFIFFLFSLTLIATTTFFALSIKPAKYSPTNSKNNSSLDPNTSPQITYQNQTYAYYYTLITNPNHLILIPNFTRQTNSAEIISQNNCQFLVNAGFYSKTNQPIGWFTTDSQTLSQPQPNPLFNGYLYSHQNQIKISDSTPNSPVTFGIQTGPILIQNSQALDLSETTDSYSRRVFAALNQDHKLYFVIVLIPNSIYEGPKLSDLPQITQQIALQLNQSFSAAINLDGGTASTFYDGHTHIQEASFIGSFFCLK